MKKSFVFCNQNKLATVYNMELLVILFHDPKSVDCLLFPQKGLEIWKKLAARQDVTFKGPISVVFDEKSPHPIFSQEREKNFGLYL